MRSRVNAFSEKWLAAETSVVFSDLTQITQKPFVKPIVCQAADRRHLTNITARHMQQPQDCATKRRTQPGRATRHKRARLGMDTIQVRCCACGWWEDTFRLCQCAWCCRWVCAWCWLQCGGCNLIFCPRHVAPGALGHRCWWWWPPCASLPLTLGISQPW